MAGGHLRSFGVLAQDLSDSEATRRVYLTAGGLLLIGLALLIGTAWWWRTTRPEHPALGPLEAMSAKRWMKADADGRARLLDGARSASAAAVPADAALGATIEPAPAAAAIAKVPEAVDLAALVASAGAVPDIDVSAYDEFLGLAPAHVDVAGAELAVGEHDEVEPELVDEDAPELVDEGDVEVVDADLVDGDSLVVDLTDEPHDEHVIDDDPVAEVEPEPEPDEAVSVIDPLLQRASKD